MRTTNSCFLIIVSGFKWNRRVGPEKRRAQALSERIRVTGVVPRTLEATTKTVVAFESKVS